jgi:hypothetical protein
VLLQYLALAPPGTAPWLIATGSVSPVSAAAGDIVTYILGYGVLGVAAVLFVLRIIVPAKAVDEARTQARADLLKENERLIAERDSALQAAHDLVPLLTSFVATSQSLIPLLQDLVRRREGP